MIRVLVVDDHPIVQRGIRFLLKEEPGFEIDEAFRGEEALEKIRKDCPDIVLLDISLPGMNGIGVLMEIRKLMPALPVLMLSMYTEEEYAVEAIMKGASGYLSKKSLPLELLSAINTVMQGKRYITSFAAELLLLKIKDEQKQTIPATLSCREYQVMFMIGEGKRINEIAAELSLSSKAVSTYRTRLLKKMGMRNNVELIQHLVRKELRKRENHDQPEAPGAATREARPSLSPSYRF